MDNVSNEMCLCGCVGYAYVPVQQLCTVTNCDDALSKGTIFPELELSMCEYGNTCKQCGGVVNG